MNISNNEIKNISNAIKILSACAVEKAKSGHPGTPVGASDIVATLFANHLSFDSSYPTWKNRDRFVLSAGHACIMLYSVLHLFGYKKFDIESIKNLRQLDSITTGHPEFEIDAGIEVTTGPLGEGVSMAVGMAIAEQVLHSKFPDIAHHYTYAFVGDGCLMEGVSYEALSLAGHLNLSKLIVIYDKNDITIDGELNIANSENISLRMQAMGFEVISIDGNNIEEIDKALLDAKKSNKPSFITAKTKIAKGAGNKEGTPSAHGSPLGDEAIATLKKDIGWNYEDFEVPQFIKDSCLKAMAKNVEGRQKWQKTLDISIHKSVYLKYTNPDFKEIEEDLSLLASEYLSNPLKIATRVASGKVLEKISKSLPSLLGGSADLASSNNTIHKNSLPISKNNFNGNYLHYGVREHGMGAIMNGIACYDNGFIPYGGTFLVFSDFLRPAIRLSALMERKVIYVFTHDSITLGADGPTHQPIEHIESLRLIPNTLILRPCDIIETIECYKIALNSKSVTPIIILGRADVPTLRTSYDSKDNLSDKGGYIISKKENASINLIGSGSELYLLFEVQELLATESIFANVVSVPCFSKFIDDTKYKESVLKNRKNFIIGMSTLVGMKEALSLDTVTFGIKTFGRSGSPSDVMNYFGFNKETITKFIKDNL